MSIFKYLFGKAVRGNEAGAFADISKAKNPTIDTDQASSGSESDENRWYFLSYFMSAKDVNKDKFIDSWSEVLGRSPKTVIKEFLSKGLIMQAGVKEKLAALYSAEDIKDFLMTQELPASGSKAQLLSRYVEALPEEAEKKASTMVGEFLLCTPEGRKKVREHGNRAVDAQDSAKIEMKRLLAHRKIIRAAEVVKVFNNWAKTPLQENTVGEDAIKLVLDIKEVPGLTRAEVEEARLHTAIDMLWYGQMKSLFYTPIPSFHQFALYASIVVGKSRSREELRSYSQQEFIKRIEIMCNDDSCRICKAMAKRTYKLKNAPLLPVDGCTSKCGCRCIYTPVVD
jgi:hypothetical protein